MSGIRFRWLALSTYIKIVTSLNDLNRKSGNPFDFDTGKAWVVHLWSNDVAVKAAKIVMYDRHLLKINA